MNKNIVTLLSVVLWSALIFFLPSQSFKSAIESIAAPKSEYESLYLEKHIYKNIFWLKGLLSILPFLLITIFTFLKNEGFFNYLKSKLFRLRDLNCLMNDKISLTILFVFTTIAVFQIFNYPIHCDEAYTFTQYIDKGPLVSISLFNLTNNHMLSNTIASFFHVVFDIDVIGLRFLSLLYSLLTLILIYRFVRKAYSISDARFSIILFVASYLFMFYSFQLRGYSLFILLSLIFILLLNEIESKNKSTLLTLVGALGLFTIPTFLFLLLFTFGHLAISNGQWRYSFIMLTKIGLLTLMLYTPIIIGNGFGVLLNNDYNAIFRKTFNLNQFFPVVNTTASILFFGTLIAIPLIVYCIKMLIKQHKDRIAINASIIIGTTLLILIYPLVKNIYIPFRVLAFVIPSVVMLIVSFNHKKSILQKSVVVGLIVTISLFNYKTYSKEYQSNLYIETLYEKLSDNNKSFHFYHLSSVRSYFEYASRDDDYIKISLTPHSVDTINLDGSDIIFSDELLEIPSYELFNSERNHYIYKKQQN